ncbi:MAG: helix-turn-helix domain-containing protein [Dechloromonas sp.]|nr:helix-turn-helix domain-containing protein [Dechloromonas sp.]
MGKHYKQLSIEERAMVQTQLEMVIKPVAIARELCRSAATLSRELNRNGWVRPKARRERGRPLLAGGYRSEAAHRRDFGGLQDKPWGSCEKEDGLIADMPKCHSATRAVGTVQ